MPVAGDEFEGMLGEFTARDYGRASFHVGMGRYKGISVRIFGSLRDNRIVYHGFPPKNIFVARLP
jgi:hypothetical protein